MSSLNQQTQITSENFSGHADQRSFEQIVGANQNQSANNNTSNKRQHSNSNLDYNTKRSVLDTGNAFKTSAYAPYDISNIDSHTGANSTATATAPRATLGKTSYTLDSQGLSLAPTPTPTPDVPPGRKFTTFSNPSYFPVTDTFRNQDLSDRVLPSSTPPSNLAQPRAPSMQQPMVSSLSDTSSIPDTLAQAQQQANTLHGLNPQQQTQAQQAQNAQAQQSQQAQNAQPQHMQCRLTYDEQVLIKKLQSSYSFMISLENDVQKKCSGVGGQLRPTDIAILMDIYRVNVQLLETYHDFLIYSLNCGKSGKQIIQIYRILRRLWVYGIVTFLDVLKNVVSIYMENDVCAAFIGFAFSILSGLVNNSIDSWVYEKIGDLSRMAIALYHSRYIDWKLSSEYWYQMALKLNYGQGKIYYHIATVQHDNLDALMNMGKAVFSRDTFLPTPQYMKMLIENINQRQNVYPPIKDFIKIHRMMLARDHPVPNLVAEIDQYISMLGHIFPHYSFFIRNSLQKPEYNGINFQFWYQRSSSFAMVNILQICGFGYPDCPFGKLFGLIDILRERKTKKERRDKKKSTLDPGPSSASGIATGSNTGMGACSGMCTCSGMGVCNGMGSDLCGYSDPGDHWTEAQWFDSMSKLDLPGLKLAMNMLKKFMTGPYEAALPHVITYLYFVLACGKAIDDYPESQRFLEFLIQMSLPVDTLVDYLNILLGVARDGFWDAFKYDDSFYDCEDENYWLHHFNRNEDLYEVWKCWGTLWFDKLCLKRDYDDLPSAGLKTNDFNDIPQQGPLYDVTERNKRVLRALLLATHISSHYNFGIKRESKCFKVHIVTQATHQDLIDKYGLLNIMEPATPANLLMTQPCMTLPSQWLKQSLNCKNVSDSPDSVINPLYYTDNEADYENSTTSPASIPTSSYNPHALHNLGVHTNAHSHHPQLNNHLHQSYHQIYRNPACHSQPMPGNLSHDSPMVMHDPSMCAQKPVSGQGDGAEINGETFFVLDTNMWLSHCGQLFKSMRSKIFLLGVPLVVFQELRSLRCNHDLTIADTATRAVITLRQLALEARIFPMRMNGETVPNINDVRDFELQSGWLEKIDDLILNSIKLRGEGVLITEDKNMRIKAKMKDITYYGGQRFWEIIKKLSEGRCYD